MEIKVLGPGCAKCDKTETVIREVLAETGVDARVEKITDMMQIAAFGVVTTPTVIVDNTVRCTGKVPKKKDVISWLA